MTSGNNRGRLRHIAMIPGLVLGLVSIGAPWLVVEIPTGASANAGWSQVAPASFSLGLAAVAAWGATLLTGTAATRVLAVSQAVLAGGSLFALSQALTDTATVVRGLAAEASGVIGAISAADTVSQWSPGWIAVTVAAIAEIAISGILGAAFPGRSRRTQRYERTKTSTDSDPWQALSDGEDPTSR